jgi:beta-phosphoglucomutase-like phosphatase (HAD superfamily)
MDRVAPSGAVIDIDSVGPVGDVRACLFDLDGVLTRTASVHAAAWKETFDAFLSERASPGDAPFTPFDALTDYDDFVDGKPREESIRSFLASRAIVLPEGGSGDDTEAPTVGALGARKNELLQRRVGETGVQVYPESLEYLHAVRRLGIPCAVVSSNTNCTLALAAAGIANLFTLGVDGVTATRETLAGKPAPDTYISVGAAISTRGSRTDFRAHI